MAEKAALQQVKSFLSDMKRLSEHLESASIEIWWGLMQIQKGGDDSLVQCEDSFDRAMVDLEEISNLSLGLMGCFYLHANDVKAHIVTNGLGSSSVYSGCLTSELRQLVCIFDEPSVRFACGLYIEIEEGFWLSHSELAAQLDLSEGTENEEPVFVLYEICPIIKSRIRKCRKNVIQQVFSGQYQEEAEALKRSGKELKNAGKLFCYAWRALSNAVESTSEESDFRSSTWFVKATNTMLSADRLLKAGKAGRLQHEMQGGRQTYAVAQVKKRWPDYASLIDAAILKAETTGTKRNLPAK